MSEIKYTPGPWRWEVNLKSKHVNLCGGVPKFDKTVMQFSRWGMGGAAPEFRVPLEDQPELAHMTRVDQLTSIVDGREHHEHWFRDINHPDAKLIAAAPDLLSALEKVRALIYSKDKETGGELVFPMDTDFGTILSTIDNTLAQLKEPIS